MPQWQSDERCVRRVQRADSAAVPGRGSGSGLDQHRCRRWRDAAAPQEHGLLPWLAAATPPRSYQTCRLCNFRVFFVRGCERHLCALYRFTAAERQERTTTHAAKIDQARANHLCATSAASAGTAHRIFVGRGRGRCRRRRCCRGPCRCNRGIRVGGGGGGITTVCTQVARGSRCGTSSAVAPHVASEPSARAHRPRTLSSTLSPQCRRPHLLGGAVKATSTAAAPSAPASTDGAGESIPEHS